MPCGISCSCASMGLQPILHAQSSDPQFQELLKKINGRRYTCPASEYFSMVIDVRGKFLVLGTITPPGGFGQPGYHELAGPYNRFAIRGTQFSYPLTRQSNTPAWAISYTFTISEDGDAITQRIGYNDGDVREYVHFWQR